MEEIEIIPLAKQKMIRRGIKESWVKEAASNPDRVVKGHAGRSVFHKRLVIGGKKRLLRVVFEETSSSLIVITAYLTSQVERYWKEKS